MKRSRRGARAPRSSHINLPYWQTSLDALAQCNAAMQYPGAGA
jgi:hypothetical protein